jgi:hypothetical protein
MVRSHALEYYRERYRMFDFVRRIPQCQPATDPSNLPLCWASPSSGATIHWGFAKSTPRQQ